MASFLILLLSNNIIILMSRAASKLQFIWIKSKVNRIGVFKKIH